MYTSFTLGERGTMVQARLESSFVVENAACLGAKSGSFDEMPNTSVTFYFLR